MTNKRWLLLQEHEDGVQFAAKLGVSPIVGQLLRNRGIDDIAEALAFLRADLSTLPDPFLMLDMEKAVQRLILAFGRQERIVIYGDYDVDGQTAATLLTYVFRQLSVDPSLIKYYIPNRKDEGYGLNEQALREIAKYASLVVTVDCGISAQKEADLARELGIDLIISDHHEPGEIIPSAGAVLNPKRQGCSYPSKNLAGVGVAYKLVQALGKLLQKTFDQHLDLVALGTVADLVPLQGENRTLVKQGLQIMKSTDKIGLQALLGVSGVKGAPDSGDLGFRLGPRLNAAGRMGDPSRGVELLLTKDPEQASALAGALDQENRSRQGVEGEIVDQAIRQVEEHKMQESAVIVVAGKNWHQGVVGIVASRLVEAYYRPIVVISIDESGMGKGSARSISGFNLYDSLRQCAELLESFGGHEMAAGLSIRAELIPELRASLSDIAKDTLRDEQYIPELKIDCLVGLEDIDEKLVADIALLEPFGMGNPAPLFQVGAAVINWRKIGKNGDHIKLALRDAVETKDAVGFGMATRLDELAGYSEGLDFAVIPQINEWNNKRQVQLVVRDVQPRGKPQNFVEKWMWENYPWKLDLTYSQISALSSDCQEAAASLENGRERATAITTIDRRGNWRGQDFAAMSTSHRILVYVHTPLDTLEVCRQIRIDCHGTGDHIGFEHELMTVEERKELSRLISDGKLLWIVSTGITPWPITFDEVVLYAPPVLPESLGMLRSTLALSGSLTLAYDSQACRRSQSYLRRAFPERRDLAAFYLAVKRTKKDVINWSELLDMANSLFIAEGLCFAVRVFEELGLLKVENDAVILLPAPEKKLDLFSAVLYNEGMVKRKQSALFLKACLERGFCNDEL